MAAGNAEMSISDLPLDMLLQVLLWLPAKYLLRCKPVSRLWFSLITDPTFMKMYETRSHTREGGIFLVLPPPIQYYRPSPASWDRRFFLIDLKKPPKSRARVHDPTSVPYTSSSISNIVNGTICFYQMEGSKEPMYLYNLATHEILPIPVTRQKYGYARKCLLGFDPVNKEYKVLNIRSDGVIHEVFTVGSMHCTWRLINVLAVNTHTRFYFNGDAFCSGGVLYWTTRSRSSRRDSIFVFDLMHEIPELIEYPQEEMPSTTLAHLRGQLSLISVRQLSGFNNIEITVWRLIDRKDNDRPLWNKEVVNYSFGFGNLALDQWDRYKINHHGQVYFMQRSLSNQAIIYIYDVATSRYMELKLNNSQRLLDQYDFQFQPSKVSENITPLKNVNRRRMLVHRDIQSYFYNDFMH